MDGETRNERDDRTVDEWQQGVPHPDDTPGGYAGDMPDHADQTSAEDTGEEAQAVRTFGKYTASEAARLRWERVRAREAAGLTDDKDEDEQNDEVILVRVPIAVGAIIRRLARDAKGGDVGSARELRAWKQDFAKDTDTSVSALDRRTRQRLLARLLEELDEADSETGTPASGGTPA